MAERFNVQLDEKHATKLRALASRTHVQPGTLARSLLCAALDEATPDAATIVEILDAIPGAFERAEQGRAEARKGQGIPLEDL